ncbi:glycosyltransferase [Streptomyces sp. NPDC052069]|uniref:glycosyltransferase n=1 Tax=Streptomyces sp. NPDC052069 TaxID=3154650 RepID=UPI00344AF0E9
MKLLFVAGGSGGVVFAITPLAVAARVAGHEVYVAGPQNVASTVTSAGLPFVAVTDRTMPDFLADRQGNKVEVPQDLHERFIFNGRIMGRFAAACVPGLLELVERWRPDVVVGGALSFAAPVIAGHLGVPFVRHAIDMGEPRTIDLAAAAELGVELAQLGLHDMPRPDLFIDICPPTMRRADAPAAQLMRYVPFVTQRQVEPWMYTRGDKPRVLVTAGSRVTKEFDFDILVSLGNGVAELDVELLIAAPEAISEELRPLLPDNVRVGWMPLDVVGRTCDLFVHHAGGNTMLAGMAYGVPQVLIPYLPYVVDYTSRLAQFGAAKMLTPEEDSTENIVAACREVLGDPSYAGRARELSEEMAAQPKPSEVVEILEKLAG